MVEIPIDRNTEVTHKMTAKTETLPLNMRPFLAGMFEKSKNLRPKPARRNNFFSRARFQIHFA
jgi:hypothetical protein